MTRLLPLLWIASVAFASTAHAEPTKVALAIEGDSSSIGMRKAVVGAFDDQDDLEFVSAQKTTRAIEQLGIGEVHSARDAKTVAKKLAVAAVVQGEFDESDHTLTLVVYANGARTGSFTIEAEDTKSAQFRKNVRKKMFAKLDGATPADAAADGESTSGREDIAKSKDKNKKAKADKADKKHGDDDDAADDTSDKKSSKSSDKADKKSGKSSDKKHGDDDDVADDKADKKSGKSSDKADKKHGHDDDVADDRADKKTGKSADKHGDKADKKSGNKHGHDDVADDTSDKKSSKSSDKADKKHGHDDDVADDKADTKSGKNAVKKHGDDAANKHSHDDDVAGDKTDKKRGDDDVVDKADKKSGKKHGDDDVADDKADKQHGDKNSKRGDDGADDDSDDETDRRDGKVASDDGDDEDPTSAHRSVTLDAPLATRNLAAIRVDLGASMTGRSLRFQSSAVDGAPSSYRAKPVPGGHLDAELYPFAFKDRHRALAGLGVGGDFDQASAFTMPTADGTGAVKVTDRSYSAGVRFRIAFGHRATSPTLTLGAGYGARTFAVDHSSGMTTGVPDVNYRMVVPSLTVRVPIGARVTAFVGGRGILLLSAGPITNADQYGRANAQGGTATAGVEVGLASHVALRLAAEGTQVDLKFYGEGTLSSMLDGDPSTIDVQRARDRYYGGDATLAVTY